MTDTTLIWIGIIGQGVPLITAIYMVTVGNWVEKRKDIKNKPKNIKNNFWIISKQEIIDEFKFDKNGY